MTDLQAGWSATRIGLRARNAHLLVIIAVSAIAVPAEAIACKNLSEDDFINKAIEEVLRFDTFRIFNYNREDPPTGEHYIPFESATELRDSNPDCCHLSPFGRDGFDLPWFTKIFSDFETFVVLDFNVRIQVGDEIQMRPVNGPMVALSSCGTRIDME